MHPAQRVLAGTAIAILSVSALAPSGHAASSAWAILPINTPSNQSDYLNAVSCSAATACTAVGGRQTGTGTAIITLAERWNGTAWASEATPTLSGSLGSQLEGVACPSATACTAVGYSFVSSNKRAPLVERWNGTAWTAQSTAMLPTGAGDTILSGVTCTAATACVAVGSYQLPGQVSRTLAERWTGSSWALQSTRNPKGAQFSALVAITCMSATACVAVGSYALPGQVEQTLAERWSGVSWAVQKTPNPSGSIGSLLTSVACTAATACTAVGAADNNNVFVIQTLAERWNGSSWVIQKTPNPAPDGFENDLSGVACTGSKACMAVGSYTHNSFGGDHKTVAESWNGAGWAIRVTPNPAGATQNYLNAVECTTAVACIAVGDYVDSGGRSLPLAERYS
jgi:hypothetical protein